MSRPLHLVLAGPPGRLRWLAAGALAALPLAQIWAYEAGFYGTTTLINQFNPYTGDLDLVPFYIPGTPGDVIYGYQSPVRLFLVLAVAGAVMAALGFGGRLAQRAAAIGMAIAFVLALSGHDGGVVLMLGLALALVGGPLATALGSRLTKPPRPPQSPLTSSSTG